MAEKTIHIVVCVAGQLAEERRKDFGSTFGNASGNASGRAIGGTVVWRGAAFTVPI
jgi:hypothetical protein